MVGSFTVKEFIPQKRETKEANHGRRKCVSLLCNEILRPLLLPYRETRHARARRGNRMKFCAIAEGIPEVQRVGSSNVLIEPQAELIRVLMYDLGRGIDVVSIVG
jgi:hypothetical protein